MSRQAGWHLRGRWEGRLVGNLRGRWVGRLEDMIWGMSIVSELGWNQAQVVRGEQNRDDSASQHRTRREKHRAFIKRGTA